MPQVKSQNEWRASKRAHHIGAVPVSGGSHFREQGDCTMSNLNEFLADKRIALAGFMAEAAANPEKMTLSASVDVRGRSGVRVIKVRQFEMVSDTDSSLAGFDLGPNSPEIQLAALGSCIAHTALMVAAMMELSIDEIGVEVSAEGHPLAQTPGYEEVPIEPHNFRYTIQITSTEPEPKIEELHRQIQATCPLYKLLVNPQTIHGNVVLSAAS